MLALRNVVDRKLSLTDACVHMGVCVCVFVFVPGGNNQFWAFGITLAHVCQNYICRQEKRTLFTLLYVSNENIKNNQFFVPNILLIFQSNSSKFTWHLEKKQKISLMWP